MEFRNEESALQYMNERKKEIMDDIACERNEYEQQYQTVRSIPEVRALVEEVIRLMREKYYDRVEFLHDHITLGNRSILGYRSTLGNRSDPTSVEVYYRSFNLNSPQRNLTGFIKFLCEEVYKKTGYDLQLDIGSAFNGSYNVAVRKFQLHPSDDDLGLPPSHNCSRHVGKRISGRNIIAEIYNFRSRYCSIDRFEFDSNENRYDMIPHNSRDIAECPGGFFRFACFYELTYIRRMSPHSSSMVSVFLFNATPNPKSKPTGGVNW